VCAFNMDQPQRPAFLYRVNVLRRQRRRDGVELDSPRKVSQGRGNAAPHCASPSATALIYVLALRYFFSRPLPLTSTSYQRPLPLTSISRGDSFRGRARGEQSVARDFRPFFVGLDCGTRGAAS
jgi:hypothetical protein